MALITQRRRRRLRDARRAVQLLRPSVARQRPAVRLAGRRAGRPGGTPHRPSREEVICCIDGELTIAMDAAVHLLRPGDVAYVPADSEIRLDGGPAAARRG